MPKNNGRTRKAWRKARADENAFYAARFTMNVERARGDTPAKSLARATLDRLEADPLWVNADDRTRAPKPGTGA